MKINEEASEEVCFLQLQKWETVLPKLCIQLFLSHVRRRKRKRTTVGDEKGENECGGGGKEGEGMRGRRKSRRVEKEGGLERRRRMKGEGRMTPSVCHSICR
jgi:hypothetical protein